MAELRVSAVPTAYTRSKPCPDLRDKPSSRGLHRRSGRDRAHRYQRPIRLSPRRISVPQRRAPSRLGFRLLSAAHAIHRAHQSWPLRPLPHWPAHVLGHRPGHRDCRQRADGARPRRQPARAGSPLRLPSRCLRFLSSKPQNSNTLRSRFFGGCSSHGSPSACSRQRIPAGGLPLAQP